MLLLFFLLLLLFIQQREFFAPRSFVPTQKARILAADTRASSSSFAFEKKVYFIFSPFWNFLSNSSFFFFFLSDEHSLYFDTSANNLKEEKNSQKNKINKRIHLSSIVIQCNRARKCNSWTSARIFARDAILHPPLRYFDTERTLAQFHHSVWYILSESFTNVWSVTSAVVVSRFEIIIKSQLILFPPP